MRKISILHPSRSRPERSKQTIDEWIGLAGVSVEVIVSIDINDPKNKEYQDLYIPKVSENFWVSQHDNRSAVDAINNAARVATGDIFIVVSDDTDCPENWAVDLLKHLEGKTDFIAKTQDGIQKWIITNPIMDRAYYNRFGYVYYPEFKHMFCDTFLTCVADLTGRKIEVPMTFEHLHYSTGKSVKDAVNENADVTWSQGENLFIELANKNFLLKPEEVKGKITNQQYLSWMKGKGIIR